MTRDWSHRELSHLIDMVPNHVWCLTVDGEPTCFNKRMTDYLGLDPTGTNPSRRITPEALIEAIHRDDATGFQDALHQSLVTGEALTTRHRLRRADGVYRWMEGRVEPLRNESGAIVNWYGVSTDIDDQVRAEEALVHANEALHNRERELSQLIDMVPVQIRRLTPDGEPNFFNRRLLDFFGLQNVAELDRPGMSRLAAGITNLVHPEDSTALLETVRRCFRTGEPWATKYRMRRADGVYRWVDGRGEPTRDQSGAIVQWYAISIDVDDEMRTQQALHDRERELSELVNVVPVAIGLLAPNGEPTFFNKRMIDFLGLDVADLAKQDMSRMAAATAAAVHPDDAAGFTEALNHSLVTGEPFSRRYRLRRADGVYRWVEGRIEPLRDQDGAIVQWYGVSLDVDDQVRLNNELRERDARIRRLVDSDVIGIVFWDLNGTLIDANDAFLRIVHYDREDLKAGLDWFAMTPPEWQEVHAREEAAELAATGKMQAREKEYFRKDGSRVPILIGAACFEDNPRQGVAYILDLTERKRAERELRDRERELQALIHTVPAQIWCVTPEGEALYINKTLADYIGLRPEDLPPGLADAIQSTVHPDDSSGLRDALGHSFRTGKHFELRFRMLRHDGAYRWTEGHAAPLRDESGRIIRWYGTNADIHDLVMSQEALRERERSLWQLVETLPVMIDCAGPDGEPIYRSRQLSKFLGYELEELDGTGSSRLARTLDAGVHPDDVASVKEQYGQSLATGEPYARRHRLRRFDGEYLWVDTRAAPMRDAEGTIVQWNVTCLDIDAEVRAQEELRLAQERLARASQAASLAELSASIAHEVNQPLAAVVANSHACQRWLSAEPANVERAKATVERIIRDANSAADVVSRVRALFRQAPHPRTLEDVNRVIREVCRLLADEIATKGIRIETALERDLPALALDRVQLQQVMVNLIRNGIESMGKTDDGTGQLEIRSSRESADAIRVEVCDSGAGFTDFERIFEPFFTTKRDGMGMGLAICRSIVESHGGRLWTANNETRGATVAFTLPLGADAAP